MFRQLCDHIEIDRELHCVRNNGEIIHLTGLEFGLLDYLSAHPNRICTRNEILDHVWGKRFQYDTGTIDVHLNALRRKMNWSPTHPIETIRGAGLCFRMQPTIAHYTIDLQSFMTDWLQKHEMRIAAAGLVTQLKLSPFVNELTLDPNALRQMLDGILSALLPIAQPGIMRISSKLTIRHFSLSLDINGTTSELKIPIYCDFDAS